MYVLVCSTVVVGAYFKETTAGYSKREKNGEDGTLFLAIIGLCHDNFALWQDVNSNQAC